MRRVSTSSLSGERLVRISPAKFDGGRVAVAALNNLQKAVAVFKDETIIFQNSRFAELFVDGCFPEELFASTTGELHLIDYADRTLSVRTVLMPEGLLVTANDVSESVAETERERQLARTDPLTLLANRRMFAECLADGLAAENREPATVLIIDLDRFKSINDSYGHATGDVVLRIVADRIRSCISEDDIAARLGGDEFAIFQPGQPQPEGASNLARRLVELLGRSYFVDGHLLNIGASIGIAILTSQSNRYEDVLRDADLAMYRAKQDGRATFRFFEPKMREDALRRRQLETELRRALALREFSLNYQPQYDLALRETTGFEALLRWTSGTRGAISPSDFIPIAEELGIIVPVGEWVLREACREAVGWPRPLTVAVNVSAVQIENDNFVATVISALAETGLRPNRLELEITESVLLRDHHHALRTLHALKDIGVRIAMDDFGTGYSSLSYLRSFPFDKIKIDQSFIRSRDSSGMSIVSAVAVLGKSLGMTVIAEGVEDKDAVMQVAGAGCHHIQGYAVGKPMLAEVIPSYLREIERAATLWSL